MSTREQEFLQRWEAEKHHFVRWGELVVERLIVLIERHVPPPAASYFLRIPCVPRLKTEQSLLQKAFFRPEKNYTHPYDDIEDKVGVRLVLLLDEDVQLIGSAIETETEVWTATKARDHEAEKAAKPYEFVYQSMHFVVRSCAGSQHRDGQPLPEHLPCEIQVRTLLQHAHSELTHDTLYKPSIQTTPQMKRAAAKSMALIEATSDYFAQLSKLIAEQLEPLRGLDHLLTEEYRRTINASLSDHASALNDLVLDRYGPDVDGVVVVAWLKERPYLGARIKDHAELSAAFRIPAILLVYFATGTMPHGAMLNSPLPDSELAKIYSDLGLSMAG